jgi:hypothetical protein
VPDHRKRCLYSMTRGEKQASRDMGHCLATRVSSPSPKMKLHPRCTRVSLYRTAVHHVELDYALRSPGSVYMSPKIERCPLPLLEERPLSSLSPWPPLLLHHLLILRSG